MQNKEIEKLLSCDNCKLSECIQCEISYTDKKKIREYIEQLENKVTELGKGQQTLIQSRRKWKNRYYKEREKKDKKIDDAINFIQDNCLEEIADMKGCYREIASVEDLQELIDILRGEKQI